MFVSETIAGVSTAVGNSGISVIRMSGPNSFSIANKIFKGKKEVIDQDTHTLQYGKLIDPKSNEVVDEVLLTKMAAPRTYTREDVIEISSHGGYTIARNILNLLYQYGARPAEPGEFTKRAFLNGRIDLSQAEAVMDVIQARTDRVSKVALKQLEGTLSHKINDLRESLITLLSSIEVNLDYPEYDAEEVTLKAARDAVSPVLMEIDSLISSFHYGKILREGMEVVIAGRPNVGKSSLMNRLTRKDRSIVTDIPGTTRDIIEEYVNIKGIPVKMIDTAGVRETFDEVEKLGVSRSIKALKTADLVLVLADACEGLNHEDTDIIQRIRTEKHPYLLLLNKVDLITDDGRLMKLKSDYPDALLISAVSDKGIEKVEESILKFATENRQDMDNQVLITNARHELQLIKAKEYLQSAKTAIESGLTLDMVSMDLKAALEELGRITGHHADEDVINAIFARFCLGK
ncbi:MAG: tRNA uridine-5-carboxymethylaminomethyl(34) synthesis GTPase MnmE [Clostridia bacterium]|nr:tRNA uridine-5-carboxymethylaminomethyl(34) synthesis GTPase MnmE [Clostridia bacterium]